MPRLPDDAEAIIAAQGPDVGGQVRSYPDGCSCTAVISLGGMKV